MTVGILGMAFKAESDDTRSSLCYKLKRVLRFRAERVLCTDPYVTVDPTCGRSTRSLREADLLVIGAPHRSTVDSRRSSRWSTSGTMSGRDGMPACEDAAGLGRRPRLQRG